MEEMTEIEKHFRRLLSEGGGVAAEVAAIRERGSRDLACALAEFGAHAHYELLSEIAAPGSWIIPDKEEYWGREVSTADMIIVRPSYTVRDVKNRYGHSQKPTIIACPVAPNSAMVPVNEAAEKIYEAWTMSIHGKAPPPLFTWEAVSVPLDPMPPRVPPRANVERSMRARFGRWVALLHSYRRCMVLYNHPSSRLERRSLNWIERIVVRFV